MDWRVLTNWDPNQASLNRSSQTPWQQLSADWRERVDGPELCKVTYAAYTLTISSPFTIAYALGHSPVIYMGEGFAHVRLKEHINNKLLPMVQTIQGAKFDLWILDCESKDLVVATEAQMLRHFEETFGAKPMYNIQGGKACAHAPHKDWFAPMDKRRIGKREWALTRLGKNAHL